MPTIKTVPVEGVPPEAAGDDGERGDQPVVGPIDQVTDVVG
jgi:hypothetical protein